jgi:hypothetical protein
MVLQDAPAGFESAATVLNSLPQDFLAQMCQEVLSFLQYKIGCVNVKRLCVQLNSAGCTQPQNRIQSAVNALTFVFRSAAKHHVTAESLAAELQHSGLFNEKAVAVIKHLWGEQVREYI